MRRLPALLQFCHLLSLVSATLQPPTNLKLSSQNFQHILSWEEPNNESLIYYCVEYSESYSPFTPAMDCSNITTRHCDLTKYLTDIMGSYRTRVHSFTHNDVSNKSYSLDDLTPYANTSLGPPIVHVAACNNCIRLSIQPPVSYLWSEEEQRNVTMLSEYVYPVLDYTVLLWPSAGDPIQIKDVSTENYTNEISSLLPNTNYCISVIASAMNTNNAVASPITCVITKAPQVIGDIRIYVIAISAVFLLILSLLCLITLDKTGFISWKKSFTPNVLKSLPIQETLFNGNNELIPLVSIISMETNGRNENEEVYTTRARLQDNASYIANNADNRVVDQQESGSQDSDCSMEEGISREHSALLDTSNLQLSGVILSEEPSNEDVVSSAEDNILRRHPKFIAVSDRRMKVPSEDTIIGLSKTGAFTSNTANNMNESFNGSNVFKIDLNSVCVADPEDLCNSLKTLSVKEESEDSVSPHTDGDSIDGQQFRLFSGVFQGDAPRMVNPGYNNNEEEDTSDKDDPNEHLPADYIKR
ncbi:uncharacterized protein LOC142139513 [Mixophyes fleayi]|uniref:uncharacterized protein LOC142139513 n=1 Tax=Mixophyes fleayi TaxID=3061075 RepID=UPI003F4DC340